MRSTRLPGSRTAYHWSLVIAQTTWALLMFKLSKLASPTFSLLSFSPDLNHLCSLIFTNLLALQKKNRSYRMRSKALGSNRRCHWHSLKFLPTKLIESSRQISGLRSRQISYQASLKNKFFILSCWLLNGNWNNELSKNNQIIPEMNKTQFKPENVQKNANPIWPRVNVRRNSNQQWKHSRGQKETC